jgi:hypothetical protein
MRVRVAVAVTAMTMVMIVTSTTAMVMRMFMLFSGETLSSVSSSRCANMRMETLGCTEKE